MVAALGLSYRPVVAVASRSPGDVVETARLGIVSIGVLADIHGTRTALDPAIADAQAVGDIDQWWVLCDIVTVGPDPVVVLAQRVIDDDHRLELDKIAQVRHPAAGHLQRFHEPAGR